MSTIGRKPATTQELAWTPEPQSENGPNGAPKISLYEQSREERIRENKERLQKLGIFELSEKLRSSAPKRNPHRRMSAEVRHTPVLQPNPTRRSSRLQNVSPVSYAEVPLKKKDGLEDCGIVLAEGSKPEIYMEEHCKLLGNTERSWELFVDGYGKDGKRIYDPIKGKTCHQCRQKTLGYRTKCCKCNLVQGQFCGDCLYMRYGEHVLEALENPNWICPVCRGICNCSLCRQAKGWPATGTLYKKISRLGYKSVAHYLIETHCSDMNEESPLSACHSSVKRVLPFAEMEEKVTQESLNSDKDENGISDWKSVEEEKQGVHVLVKRPLSFSKEGGETFCLEENADSAQVELKVEDELEKLESGDKQEVGATDEEDAQTKRNYSVCTENDQDSIGGRLRQKHRLHNGSNVKGGCAGDGLDPNIGVLEPQDEKNFEQHKSENEGEIGNTRPKRKLASISTEPNQDSIGGRLRQRRKMQNGKQ
ncbi:hypothetical protein SAY86_026769 [Trapa natans]|uniref:Zinc-finger domain-containing protein n=1 Tax=Trapa natans TaxID=22666 RepID=A0AAN7QF70_TRANT|nr:hypothetical protein SAY86_026769 [Trapa natans]